MRTFVLLLTLFRILAGPVIFLLVIFLDAYYFSLAFFLFASFSDYLDGKLARLFNVESSLGALLDPIADKILVLFALIAITLKTNDPFIALMSAMILGREFWISALREYAAQNSISDATKVLFLSKIKTSVQFLSIFMFFTGFAIDNAFISFLASFLLFLALLLTFKTAIDYSKKVFSDS